ncbi:hypothetical protein ACYCFK_06685 [Stutzerimonas stutzeri]|uniref:hypothetical protein n=1 Tax=Stutzerimonas stutzeri TaxID=316 RepID=UPI0015E3E053|nr:hypothetical protein [Stutzerimonas stutzeri]MBA1262663.1 hypothetical protein [Stutzerimonas stutzeri]
MKQPERGEENPGTLEDRVSQRPSQGEAAGGDRNDVPGGAYNVPPGMADEVSEADAQRDRQRGKHNPER